jgi:phosphate-selective porin OprO/OprP
MPEPTQSILVHRQIPAAPPPSTPNLFFNPPTIFQASVSLAQATSSVDSPKTVTTELLPQQSEQIPAGTVADLQKRLADVEKQLSQVNVPAKPKNDVPGAYVPNWKLTGEMQSDAVWFNQSPQNRQAVGDAQDGVDFRRARIGAQGNVSEMVDYRFEWDFAMGGRPTFLDVYGTLNELPYLGHVRVGHFFEPFSMSRIMSNRYDIFMERPLPTVFAPGRRTGVMVFNDTENDRMTFAASAYGGSNDNFGDTVSDDGGWAGAGRVTWNPWYDEPSGGRYYMHLGAAYSYSGVTDHLLRFATTPEIRLTEGSTIEPIFLDTGFIRARRYQLYGSEFILTAGPWSISSEYMWVPVSTIDAPHPTFSGAYVMGSYTLTGEHRPYIQEQGNFGRLVPFEDFFRIRGGGRIITGKGAWQLAARWSYINFNGANVQAGVLNDVSLGLNWYLNPYTRVSFNYIHAMLDDPILGASQANCFGVRFQVDFGSPPVPAARRSS